jgi:hypothetical protein
MRPLEKVYWLRLPLGIVAALACIGYGLATGDLYFGMINTDPSRIENISMLFNGTAIALIIYLLSYYAIKYRFGTMVQKPQKLVTTGIGIYLLSWIVFWVLFYTTIGLSY